MANVLRQIISPVSRQGMFGKRQEGPEPGALAPVVSER
jgi:hypothetical protein